MRSPNAGHPKKKACHAYEIRLLFMALLTGHPIDTGANKTLRRSIVAETVRSREFRASQNYGSFAVSFL